MQVKGTDMCIENFLCK